MEHACQYTSVEVMEYLVSRNRQDQNSSDVYKERLLPPVTHLGFTEEKSISDNKQILNLFRNMFYEPMDEDGNSLGLMILLFTNLLTHRVHWAQTSSSV
jgi:hypothetical protein